ncbi:MarR family winged helix-turn-helix transcriptional regulator [Microbacterium sp.]|uniref:MarR family winged helix-turn-helix transcriptional regulator n=1 Tax=Microbacterium sp. TaxID=51671 RepID=UPI003A83D032
MAATGPHDDPAVTLRELGWLIHRRAPDRAGAGPLPTTELALLKQVLDDPGATVSELAAHLGLRQPNVSAAARSLEDRGLVERRPDTLDGRVTRVYATATGRREHTAIADEWTRPVRDALATLPSAHRATLADAEPALRALHSALK